MKARTNSYIHTSRLRNENRKMERKKKQIKGKGEKR